MNKSKPEDRGMKDHTPSVQRKQQRTSKAPGRAQIQARDIGAFFASMKAAFPMWNIEPSEINIGLWHAELAGFTVNDLREAYHSIMNPGSAAIGKSPPTLPEVKAACRGSHSGASGRDNAQAALPPPQRVSKEKSEENVARLRRIMSGVELEIDKHCSVGHLSPLMRARFRDSVNDFPTYNGKAIDPAYIRNQDNREKYEAEIAAWREERPNV